jgi:hypothetical protein
MRAFADGRRPPRRTAPLPKILIEPLRLLARWWQEEPLALALDSSRRECFHPADIVWLEGLVGLGNGVPSAEPGDEEMEIVSSA